ncbi:MAG: GNAT family N-acetyltransferase [Desulfuromonadales bacterium]|nr:GNAT family N-acetyltransferase [Desulfuromonadales bacterium]
MSIEQLTIREVEADDLATLLTLYRQLDVHPENKQFGLEQAEKIYLRIGTYPDYSLYLAEWQQQVVGTFALLIMDSLGHHGVPAAVLEDVVVSEEYRGTGIGQKMMQFATSLARDKGCNKFFFSSGVERTQAHQFYANLGFKQHGYSFYLNL